jgi:hypothetical protein
MSKLRSSICQKDPFNAAACRAPYITMAILFSVVLNVEIEWFRVLQFDSKQYNLSSTEIPVSTTIRVGWKTGS